MKPINIDEIFHQGLKIQAAVSRESMYQIMNRYVQLGLWYDSLSKDVQADIDKEVEQFLINKESNE